MKKTLLLFLVSLVSTWCFGTSTATISVCQGTTFTLTPMTYDFDTTLGGWAGIPHPHLTTVDISLGRQTFIATSPGTDTVIRSEGTGGDVDTWYITVLPSPTISASDTICRFGNNTFTATTSDPSGYFSIWNGSWHIVSILDTSTGWAWLSDSTIRQWNTLSTGLDSVSYTNVHGCTTKRPFYVADTITFTITGQDTLTQGLSTTLTTGVPGTWTSLNTSTATVSLGLVTGVSPDTVTISFTSSATCPLTKSHLMGILPDSSATTEIVSQVSVRMYPNPTTDYIYIDNYRGEAKVLNMEGKEVAASTSPVKVGNLPAGTYFMVVGTSVQRFTKL